MRPESRDRWQGKANDLSLSLSLSLSLFLFRERRERSRGMCYGKETRMTWSMGAAEREALSIRADVILAPTRI